MSILDQHTLSQISDLSEACARYWELRGIAGKSRKEMQIELEQHLIQAAMDGKSLETVVGPNPAAFAEAWAREVRPHVSRSSVLLLPGLAYALNVVSTTTLVQHLFAPTSSFTLTLFAAYLLVSSGLGTLLLPLAGFLAGRIKTRTGRSVLLGTILVLGTLVARSAGMRINWSIALLSWSWPLTFLLVSLAAVLACLECWRRTSQERTLSGQHVRLGRSVMTFAGSVAVFDLILGISSLAVFNACTLACRVF
jgi:hypothetical protein